MHFVDHELIADQQDRQPGSLRLEENAGSLPYVSARKTKGPLNKPQGAQRCLIDWIVVSRSTGRPSAKLQTKARLLAATVAVAYYNAELPDG
jgi:hypothetical protein